MSSLSGEVPLQLLTFQLKNFFSLKKKFDGYSACREWMNVWFFMQPPIYAGYLYNAVYQFGLALNRSQALLESEGQNRTPTGADISAQLRDYTFDG